MVRGEQYFQGHTANKKQSQGSTWAVWLLVTKFPMQLYLKKPYFANKGLSSQGYGFSSGHVWMWELDCEQWEQSVLTPGLLGKSSCAGV